MTARIGASPPPAAPPAAPGASRAERLRGVARQLEGVFVEQMFKAMRETVPDGGALSGGSGEEMFTGMLDQSLAGEVPGRWSNGLAEALYRQLQQAAGVEGEGPGTSDHGPGNRAAAVPPAPGPWAMVAASSPASSAAAAVPILDGANSTSAASARAVLPEPQ